MDLVTAELSTVAQGGRKRDVNIVSPPLKIKIMQQVRFVKKIGKTLEEGW